MFKRRYSDSNSSKDSGDKSQPGSPKPSGADTKFLLGNEYQVHKKPKKSSIETQGAEREQPPIKKTKWDLSNLNSSPEKAKIESKPITLPALTLDIIDLRREN
jgi:hypothetical protein